MIRRAPREQNFTVLPNAALDDERLSFRARGVLAHILSKPDHWHTNARQLAAHAPEGRYAINAAMRELKEVGYAKLETTRSPDGLFVKEWLIADEPCWSPATTVQLSDPRSPDPRSVDRLVSTEEQELNRTTGDETGNQPTREDQLAHLRAVKQELRHVGGT